MITKIDYPEDCIRIQKALLSKGFEATLSECQELWEERSERWDAGWLILPESEEEILLSINEYSSSYPSGRL